MHCKWAEQLLGAIPHYGYVSGGTGGYDWIDAPLAQPMKVIGGEVTCGKLHPDCIFTTFGQYRKDVFTSVATGGKVVVFSYAWRNDLWLITGAYVRPDIRENTIAFPSTRHSAINAGLKVDVIDNGLSDAVGYLSSLGKLELDGMESAICAMLSDSIGIEVLQPGAGCMGRFKPSDIAKLNHAEFNFLSHSLGSRMLFDLLSSELPSDTKPRATAETSDMALCTRSAIRARTRELIMAANQMPLLAPSEFRVVPAASADSRGNSLPPSARVTRTSFINLPNPGCVQAADLDLPPPSLTVVGFHDPDDLLGFKASDAERGTTDGAVKFIDVLHRNTNQWAFVFANPKLAHDSELEESHSQMMIMCGARELSGGRLQALNCKTPKRR